MTHLEDEKVTHLDDEEVTHLGEYEPAPDEEVPVAGDADVGVPAPIITPLLVHQAVVRHGLDTADIK